MHEGRFKNDKKIDKDLKLKKTYKIILIIGIVLIVGGSIFLNLYQCKNEWVDRYNPFIEMKIGYATLPPTVTYNNGKEYHDDGKSRQFPDPVENIWVADDPFGDGMRLTFKAGQSPKGKNYALVQHKGAYVRRISFVSWDSIPGIYRDTLNKEYIEIPKEV